MNAIFQSPLIEISGKLSLALSLFKLSSHHPEFCKLWKLFECFFQKVSFLLYVPRVPFQQSRFHPHTLSSGSFTSSLQQASCTVYLVAFVLKLNGSKPDLF